MKSEHPSKIDREMENYSNLVADLATQRTVWDSRPTTIEFSFNNLCNLKCRMCAKADDEPNELMDKDVARRSLQEMLPYVLHWMPSANSEPLLNDMTEIHDLCIEHISWLMLFTNATLLTKEKFLAIRERTHRIFISFDSHVKEAFEEIRTGAKYDVVLQNIKDVLPLAKEDGTEVTFNVVLMKPNLEHLPDYVRFVAELGADAIHVQELLPNSSFYKSLTIEHYTEEEVRPYLEGAREIAKECQVDLFLDVRPPFQSANQFSDRRYWTKAPIASMREQFMSAMGRQYPKFCNMASHYAKVNPDGSVFPCCRGPEDLNMGNLHEKSFDEIWNGERYQKFRKQMFEGDYPTSCENCYVLVGNPEFQKLIGRERAGFSPPDPSSHQAPKSDA